MALTIILPPEHEERIRDAAAREGLAPEQLAAQRLMEAELLWQIRTAAPERETRELHRMLRRGKMGSLTEAEQVRLQSLLDEREKRGALRLQNLAQLSRLRAIPVRQLMEDLGIRPIPTP
ncbi:MAG: hypothetical protein LC772_01770 [Chloroflexi bacterium]|nr:hypothetical protein [Chloroflexota bacterium]